MHGTSGAAARLKAHGASAAAAGTDLAPIRYPFERHPRGAETFEVAPGILWARVPLPFRLNHVNVWLLREADGWTTIDTGTSNDEARAIWDELNKTVLADAPVVRMIATHGHTDHVGLAGVLSEQAGTPPYHITLVEWLHATVRIDESRSPMAPQNLKFLTMHGCDDETIASFVDERRRTNAQMVPLPAAIQRLRDGDTIRFGGRTWEVMVCGGHAAEHASFWCADDKILIAGDQVLSKISPMIGVFAGEPEADPLSEYLASLDRFRRLPVPNLVLPSHGLPFKGLHARVEELDHHHHLRLGLLEGLMQGPRTTMELARGLFPKACAEGQGRHAFSETLAHIHYLASHNRAERRIGEGGRYLFSRSG